MTTLRDDTDRTPPALPPLRPAPPAPRPASEPRAEERFVPGTMLTGRYRVAGLLGRGGMGEVYRADDLVLGETVALKFLPPELERDTAALERFRAEVRIARRITHPNVCRVFDLGEVHGRSFLSMEYIDGEDLASLLRRIGRLPSDKGLVVARQLCAGLAAAHEQGVLHRDLKPSNVMIDGRGRAKITDFGLAGVEAGFGRRAAVEGTPAYQAPEQLAGHEVTARSDVYALGLVLYELLTGRRAFAAGSRAELMALQSSAAPSRPASVVPGIDPLVEDVVMRCLAPEPADRPASALQVAAMLPGGDPLAAALAAGETPSPEMVAAASKQGSLRPLAAAGGLLLVLLLLAAIAGMKARNAYFAQVASRSPGELSFLARELGAQLDLWGETADVAYDWSLTTGAAAADLPAAGPRERRPVDDSSRPPWVGFWYRASPRPILAAGRVVTLDDPPLAWPGEAVVLLDPTGRLWRVEAVPPRRTAPRAVGEAAAGEPAAPDWSGHFAAAGLDPAAFTAAEPRWPPPRWADRRQAWTGRDAEGEPLRVEAAAEGGVPVWFELMRPDGEPVRDAVALPSDRGPLFGWLLFLFYTAVLVASVVLARRNLRLGRSDRAGAVRVALGIGGGVLWASLCRMNHVPGPRELGGLLDAVGSALAFGAFGGVAYLALEPILRRRWPDLMIGWNRFLAGRWSDGLVGRDVLLGTAAGLSAAASLHALTWMQALPAGPLLADEVVSLPRHGLEFAGWFGIFLMSSLIVPISCLLFVLLLSLVTRRRSIAFVLFWLAFGAVIALGPAAGHGPLASALGGLLLSGLWTLVLARLGLLAGGVFQFVLLASNMLPVIPDPNSWLFPYAAAFALVVLTIAGWGAWTAIGGRSGLAAWLPEEA